MIELQIKNTKYPSLLKEIPKPPSILYLNGNIDCLKQPTIAIVGTRKATPYGLKMARGLARDLAAEGITIVSGLALGIDAEAHIGTLEADGKTIAVLGSGINQVYPSTNRLLAKKIIECGGAIVSEFTPDLKPDKWTFPQRNRIIAGLSQMTIVVEAPKRSGALITAYLALDYNREVGAIPGEIESINSDGTNNLIRLGATLIRSADDVLEVLGINKTEQKLNNLDEMEKIILQHLSAPQNIDNLLKQSALPANILNQKLSMLELKGIVKNTGGLWEKN